jgi:hypothetical protein
MKKIVIHGFILVFTGVFSTALFAQSYPDSQLDIAATSENIAKGLEVDAYSIGVQAYVWGYPLVRMERVIRDYIEVPANKPATSYRAPLNQMGWATELATPASKDMPTANNDTFYMSSVVTLTEPYILTVPDTKDRYYVINVFNMYQELEHYVGRRTTGTKAGQYVIVPPGWEKELPKNMKVLQTSTDKVWLWGRLHVGQTEDKAPVIALEKQFDLRPLSQLGKGTYKNPVTKLDQMPSIADNELGFFVHLAYALKTNPIRSSDEALFAQFERIGLTKKGFDQSKLSAEQIKGLKRALSDAPYVPTGAATVSGQKHENWYYLTGLDNFGFNYPLRALIAGAYLGGNGEKEAVYPACYTDTEGKPLTGAKKYTLKFTKAPPVNAFWSLTMYNSDDKMLVGNPIHRYKVGSETSGLYIEKDGSFSIIIQYEEPKGVEKENWLPAPATGFYMMLRMYQPKDEVLNGTYPLPHLTVKN